MSNVTRLRPPRKTANVGQFADDPKTIEANRVRAAQAIRNDLGMDPPRQPNDSAQSAPITFDAWSKFVVELYNNIGNEFPKDWHENLGHPFRFRWQSEEFREQVIHMLLTNGSRKTDYAGKDLLRWLLYRFRVAQFRSSKDTPLAMRRHRWIWATNAEVSRATGLSDVQLRRAAGGLEKAGLIVRASDYALHNIIHYRPTVHLFRFCQAITAPCNEEVINAQAHLCDEWPETLEQDVRDTHDDMMKDHHDTLAKLVQAFTSSTAPERAGTFMIDYCALLEKVIDAQE